MPKVSEFFGISIYIYWFDLKEHKLPHFHVRYKGATAVFDLEGNILAGAVSLRTQKLIKEWCVERKSELLEAWQHAVAGKDVPWIQPIE